MSRGRPPVIFGRVAECQPDGLVSHRIWRVDLSERLYVEVWTPIDPKARRLWYGWAMLRHNGQTLAEVGGLLTRASAVAAIEAKTREVLKELRAVRL